jgi:transketolase C-terminal domain/subunit
VGITRRSGENIAIVTSGSTLLIEALKAAQILSSENINVSLYSYPFLGSKPTKDFLRTLAKYSQIIVLENHLPTLGNFHILNNSLQSKKVFRLGLENLPRNGRDHEVLAFHNLDAQGIALFIKEIHSY